VYRSRLLVLVSFVCGVCLTVSVWLSIGCGPMMTSMMGPQSQSHSTMTLSHADMPNMEHSINMHQRKNAASAGLGGDGASVDDAAEWVDGGSPLPSPASRWRHRPAPLVTIQNVLPFATTEGDTTGVLLRVSRPPGDDASDPYRYDVCSYTNVCAAPDALYMYVQDESEYNRLSDVFRRCFAADKFKQPDRMYGPCFCFYPAFKPKLLPFYRKHNDTDSGSSEATSATAPPATPSSSSSHPSLPSHRRQTSVHPLSSINRAHFFSIHKYVKPHHIAHWAQKLVLFQSAYQYSPFFPQGDGLGPTVLQQSYDPTSLERVAQPFTSNFPPLAGMVFHDMTLPLSLHEQAILNYSVQAVNRVQTHEGLQHYLDGKHDQHIAHTHAFSNFIFQQEIEGTEKKYNQFIDEENERRMSGNGKGGISASDVSASTPTPLPSSTSTSPPPPHLHCYSRLSFTRAFGIVSTSPMDTAAFRSISHHATNTDVLKSRCPPRRIVMLYRENRGIKNHAEIAQLITAMTGKKVERKTIDAKSTHKEQIQLFAGAGLLLSSHSSQLINVLFSHPHSSMIEVTAEFFNADFAEYAHGMGVFFQYALGGQVINGVDEPGARACVDVLSRCHGNSQCILRERFNCPKRGFANKPRDFIANLTAVEIAVRQAVMHMDWACGGKW